LCSIEEGIFHVKSTAGNTHLGGEDFDDQLLKFMRAEFLARTKKDLTADGKAIRRLRTACERAKRVLSSKMEAQIELEALFEGIDFSVHTPQQRRQYPLSEG
jgi:heat shock protein 1/8